jgi:citrate synthase
MKKSEAPLYLNAGEAAAELSIAPATLYAYVSRGLIRSEPGEGARNRRYRAEDVRALKTRRVPPSGRTTEAFDAAVPILDSAVTAIGEEGPLYRGTSAAALAQTASLEHVATLLWDVTGDDPFAPSNMPFVSPAMSAVMLAARDARPIDRTIAVLALAGDADPHAFNRTPEGRAAAGARILRLVASAILGTPPSAAPIHKQVTGAWGVSRADGADLIRRALVLLADHELNASTFAVRVAASTGISLYDAVIAGLAALKGPRHGGASSRASNFVASLADGDATALIRERVALGERLPGFGHFLYTHGDPRGFDMLEALAKSGADKRLVADVPASVAEATGEIANCDYALAVLARTLALPPGSEIALFAIARTAGWIAHGSEQLQTGGLIRPRARYVGPAPGRSKR